MVTKVWQYPSIDFESIFFFFFDIFHYGIANFHEWRDVWSRCYTFNGTHLIIFILALRLVRLLLLMFDSECQALNSEMLTATMVRDH